MGSVKAESIDTRIKALVPEFYRIFGDSSRADVMVFHAPGRVNIIGEHTDYNGGYVLPAALNYGTLAVIRKREDGKINLASTNMSHTVSESVDGLAYKKENDWGNYPLGVVLKLREAGYEVGGADILFSGNIPNGAGLSSSASIELATGVAIAEAYDLTIDRVEMVKLCQKAENEFIGVKCGIMDQYSIGMGKRNHAIFLNCKTVQHQYVPMNLRGHKIVIANTNKRRGLADSKYNERRSECQRGLEMLKTVLPGITCLGDVSVSQFEQHRDAITDPLILKRVQHVVYEDDRVLEAVSALREGSLATLGRLMIASHESLRDLYEVTGRELDTLVEEALKAGGVIGSRMTGAGFGGCTVSLVREDAIEEFERRVAEGYTSRTGLRPDFYISDVGDGASRVK